MQQNNPDSIRKVVLVCPICEEGTDIIELNDRMEWYSYRCSKCRKDIDFDVKSYLRGK